MTDLARPCERKPDSCDSTIHVSFYISILALQSMKFAY